MDLERFDRQLLLFGREGQEKIAATRVAIVGLGGIGSHVAQQLAYLGVRRFALLDGDVVTISNLNRLIGSTEEDVARATPKVQVAARTIRSLDPSAEIVQVDDSFVTPAGVAALADSQVIFGCVDRDGARLLLTEFACAYDQPYFDLATDTRDDEQRVGFGGRLMIRTSEPGCAYCLDLLDLEEVLRDLSSVERRAEEDAMYGVPPDALDQRGPSIVSLNGILASLGVMEFILFTTGATRPPKRLLRYDGLRGVVIESKDQPRPGCPYCAQIGKGAAVDWLRHVRARRLAAQPERRPRVANGSRAESSLLSSR
jgi:molybdopterin/thiamine biosynthesis adenylyltransferase